MSVTKNIPEMRKKLVMSP